MVVSESSINNIMGGLESTGGVRLHNHRRKLKQRFDIVRKLGQGTYGKVQMGINKETGQEVAIKTIKKCKIETEADLIRIRREIQIMSSVQHPNIIHIYEVFENREKMVLVMEYAAGGELYDFLSERKVLSEEEARRIFRQIATAVYYCHKHKICHRDLKLENILLDENGNAKIADFGLSNVFDECRLLSTFCGSPLYASPEIVKGTPYHGPEVDCWSLGVLLYTLVYGAMPFDGSNFKRLVRQISQGDYFEPKKPSPASPLIRDMLNVNPSRRADIAAICSHWWVDMNQSEPCLEIAEELANQTPVRLDLLLSLAPNGSSDKLLVDQVNMPGQPAVSDRPLRSQSLGSLASTTASAQPIDFMLEKCDVDTSKRKADDTVNGVKKKEKSKSRRERSSSRNRRDDSTPEPDTGTEKPKRRSVKASKKKSNDTVVLEETKEEEEIKAKEDTVIEEDLSKSQEKQLELSVPVSNEVINDKTLTSEEVVAVETPNEIIEEKFEEKKGEEAKDTVSKPVERRKSKIFETAEKFNNIVEPAKSVQKKVIIPGVKVSDAKKAYERRSSLASSGSIARGSPSRKSVSGESNLSTPETEEKFLLASSVNLNKLVESVEKMSELDDNQTIKATDGDTNNNVNIVTEPEMEEVETTGESRKEGNKNEEELVNVESNKKVKNAAQVISNVLNDVGTTDSKAATLPRRRTSRAEIKLAMPSRVPEYKSEVEHVVGNPTAVQRSEVIFPVAAPSTPKPATPVTPFTKPVKRQESFPREHIIPIQMEEEAPKPQPQPAVQQQRRTSTASLSRQSTQDSETGSVTSQGEPIRKSPREVIIPIAVEGGGYVTPSTDTLTRMGSLNESEDDLPRGFGLRSSRRHNRQLETADSISSDEDDDNFEILTAENLFSTLLSRVRSLTQRLNVDEGRPAGFPRLFNHHSIFDTPASRRLSEARSFTRGEASPWRRSISRDSSTLPRGLAVDSLQRHIHTDIGRPPKRVGSLKSSVTEKPPIGRLKLTRTTSDSISKGIEQGRFDKRSISYSEDYKKNLNMRSQFNPFENMKLNNCISNNDNSLIQKDITSGLNPRRVRSLSVDRKTDMVTREKDEITKANTNILNSGKSILDHEKFSLRNVHNKSVERMSLEKQENDDNNSDIISDINGVKKENNSTISSDNQQLFSKKFSKSREDGQNEVRFSRDDIYNKERNGICSNRSSNNTAIPNDSAVSPEKSHSGRKHSKSLEKLLSENQKEDVTASLTKAHGSGEDAQNKILSSEKEMKSLLGNINSSNEITHKGNKDSIHNINACLPRSEKLVKSSRTACNSDMKNAEKSFLKRSEGKNVGNDTDYKKKNVEVSNLPRSIPKKCLSEKKTAKTGNISRNKNNIGNNENYSENKDNNSETFTNETLSVGSTPKTTNTYNDKFGNHKLDLFTDSIHADRKFSLDSTCSLFNDITGKVTKGNDQSYIYSAPLGLYSQINRDSINKFDRSNGLVTDRTEKASSFNDYILPRPHHMLGRTLSYSGPRLNHSYNSYRSYQVPASGRYGSLIREPCLDYGKYISGYTQSRSMYGNRDSISSELHFKDSSDSGYCDGVKDDVRASVITTRIPSYQRSISENQESTSGHLCRSLSVTPERSVLEKILSKEKSESEMKGNTLNKEKKGDKSDNKSKTRVRKISRFLRPDFYDTPLEESVFSKNKDKRTDKLKQKDIESNKEKCSGKDEKRNKPSLQCEKACKQENKLSIIEKAIRSLRERSLGRGDSSCMSSESNLIKRAVSLDDCSFHHDNRLRRSSSVTPKPVSDKKQAKKVDKNLFKKKCDVQKICEEIKNAQKNVDNSIPDIKETFIIENIVRKDNVKLDNATRRSSVSCGAVSSSFGESFNSSRGSDFSVSVGDDSGIYSVKKCHSLEIRSRAGRIAGLRALDFSYPNKSADSASNFEDDKSKTSFEIDDSTSFLSPTEDSDTWSASSDYADARDFSSPSGNTEDSVSERIRRKSFYLRFNQSKRRKPPSVPLGHYNSQRSKLPYTRSVSSDIAYVKNLQCNMSDVNKKEHI